MSCWVRFALALSALGVLGIHPITPAQAQPAKEILAEADRKNKRHFCAGSSGAHLPEPPPPPASGQASPGVCTRLAWSGSPPERSGARAGVALLPLGLDTHRRTGEGRTARGDAADGSIRPPIRGSGLVLQRGFTPVG